MLETLPTLPAAVRERFAQVESGTPQELEAVGLSGASIPGKDRPCIPTGRSTVQDVCRLEMRSRSK